MNGPGVDLGFLLRRSVQIAQEAEARGEPIPPAFRAAKVGLEGEIERLRTRQAHAQRRLRAKVVGLLMNAELALHELSSAGADVGPELEQVRALEKAVANGD